MLKKLKGEYTMIKLIKGGVYYMEGKLFKESAAFMVESKKQQATRKI